MEGIVNKELKKFHDDRRWRVESCQEDEIRHEDGPSSPYRMD